MQAAGQNALGRSHLQTSMFQTEQFYCMINFNWKHLVVWSILIENTWFCPVGTVITLFYHVHFENKESSASRSSSLVDALTLSKRERGRKERNISNGICQCDYWKIFEL